MKKILSSPLFYPTILVLLCLFVAFKNYTPGTFLTGWDTLHPEFDFNLNFKRLIFGVWRSEQGLGDLSGHSAMADLPRVVILWLFHFIFPLSFLRYSYVFLCLIIGPLAFYFLLKYLFQKSNYSSLLSFLGTLVYLFNLGTLQQFYVPFEMFPTQWAFLPLLILFSLKYLHSPKPKYLLTYLFFTFLATPQAYAAQLWYAFFAVYTLFLFLYTIFHHLKLKIPLILFLSTLFVNSFWLLPNLYYALTSTQNTLNNKNNRLFSQEYLYQNRATGTLENTSLIKGFYFNWNEYDFQRKSSDELTTSWNQHLNNFDIKLIGNLLFLLSFSGLIAAFIKKNKTFKALSPFFIIPFFLLANSTPIIRIPFDLLLKISLFQELFRFVFTKVSILFTFAFCLYFTYTLNLLFEIFTQIKFRCLFSVILIFSLILYCFPYFKGQFISPIVRINIPNSYFDLYRYLQTQEQGRILSLPLNNFSGWQYYSWNYQGSGFLWFGFPQSLLDRDSDRWEEKNEEAFKEFHYPLYAKNETLFLSSLYKYNIKYLLWDQSVIPASPKNRDQITFKYEIQNILNSLVSQNKITLLNQFDSLYLYQINDSKELINLQQINNFIGPAYSKNYWDPQYTKNDYLTTNTSLDTLYPVRNLLNSDETISNEKIDLLSSSLITSYQAKDLFSFNPTNTNLKIIDNSLQIKSLNSVQGIEFELTTPHSSAYILSFETKYLTGIPLRFCLKNSYTSLCTLEDQVGKNKNFQTYRFLIPPMDEFDNYTLSINALSYGNFPSISQIKSFSLYQIDPHFFYPTQTQANQSFTINYQVIFPNNSLIKVDTPSINSSNKYLTLYQSYNKSWLAFYFDDYGRLQLLSHYLVNNWANAWDVSTLQNKTIYILFWPQLLEFLGFILLLVPLIFCLKPQSHTPPTP